MTCEEMASKLTAALVKDDEHGTGKQDLGKERKKKDKMRKKTDNAMGCGSSQAVVINTEREKRELRPTIFMVADDNFRMLRELGELKFYQIANYTDVEETEFKHRDFMTRLENPVQYMTCADDNQQTSVTTSNSTMVNNTSTVSKVTLPTMRHHAMNKGGTSIDQKTKTSCVTNARKTKYSTSSMNAEKNSAEKDTKQKTTTYSVESFEVNSKSTLFPRRNKVEPQNASSSTFYKQSINNNDTTLEDAGMNK